MLNEMLVEAAGVEPASENVTSQETTCLFRFMPQSLGLATQPGTFAADAQNGQETQAASLKVSSSSPDVAGKTSPLYDVLTAAHGRSLLAASISVEAVTPPWWDGQTQRATSNLGVA